MKLSAGFFPQPDCQHCGLEGHLENDCLHQMCTCPIEQARTEHRPHSLIASHRFWQQVATAPGVVAWGYAYAGGEFVQEWRALDSAKGMVSTQY